MGGGGCCRMGGWGGGVHYCEWHRNTHKTYCTYIHTYVQQDIQWEGTYVYVQSGLVVGEIVIIVCCKKCNKIHFWSRLHIEMRVLKQSIYKGRRKVYVRWHCNWIRTHVVTSTHAHTHAYPRTHTHTHKHAHTHTRKHTHTHASTHMHLRWCTDHIKIFTDHWSGDASRNFYQGSLERLKFSYPSSPSPIAWELQVWWAGSWEG